MNKIRVLICDSHSVVRSGVRALLEVQGDMEVVGEAASGAEAIELARRVRPHVVLMDIALPLIDGLTATRRITKANPGVKVLVLAQQDDKEYALSSVVAGASGFLPKKAGPVELMTAIRTVNEGDSFFHPSALKWMVQEYLHRMDQSIAARSAMLAVPACDDNVGGNSAPVGILATKGRSVGRAASLPAPAIVGPLIGLVYVLILPCVVFGTLARAGVSWAAHTLAAAWRRLAHAHLAAF